MVADIVSCSCCSCCTNALPEYARSNSFSNSTSEPLFSCFSQPLLFQRASFGYLPLPIHRYLRFRYCYYHILWRKSLRKTNLISSSAHPTTK